MISGVVLALALPIPPNATNGESVTAAFRRQLSGFHYSWSNGWNTNCHTCDDMNTWTGGTAELPTITYHSKPQFEWWCNLEHQGNCKNMWPWTNVYQVINWQALPGCVQVRKFENNDVGHGGDIKFQCGKFICDKQTDDNYAGCPAGYYTDVSTCGKPAADDPKDRGYKCKKCECGSDQEVVGCGGNSPGQCHFLPPSPPPPMSPPSSPPIPPPQPPAYMSFDAYSDLIKLHDAVNAKTVDDATTNVENLIVEMKARATDGGGDAFLRDDIITTLQTMLAELKHKGAQPLSPFSSQYLMQKMQGQLTAAMFETPDTEQSALTMLKQSAELEDAVIAGFKSTATAWADTFTAQANSYDEEIDNCIEDLTETFKQRDRFEQRMRVYKGTVVDKADALEAALRKYYEDQADDLKNERATEVRDAVFDGIKGIADIGSSVAKTQNARASAAKEAAKAAKEAAQAAEAASSAAVADENSRRLAAIGTNSMAFAAQPGYEQGQLMNKSPHKRELFVVTAAVLGAVSTLTSVIKTTWDNVETIQRYDEKIRAMHTMAEDVKSADCRDESADQANCIDPEPAALAKMYRPGEAVNFTAATAEEALELLGRDDIRRLQAGAMASDWDEVALQADNVLASWYDIVPDESRDYMLTIQSMVNNGKDVMNTQLRALEIMRKMQSARARQIGIQKSADIMKESASEALALDASEAKKDAIVKMNLAMVHALTSNAVTLSKTLRELCASFVYDGRWSSEQLGPTCSLFGGGSVGIKLPSPASVRRLLDGSDTNSGLDRADQMSPRAYMNVYKAAVENAKTMVVEMSSVEPNYGRKNLAVEYIHADRLTTATRWDFEVDWSDVPFGYDAKQPRIVGWVPVFQGIRRVNSTSSLPQYNMIRFGLQIDPQSRVYEPQRGPISFDAPDHEDFELPAFPMWYRYATDRQASAADPCPEKKVWKAGFKESGRENIDLVCTMEDGVRRRVDDDFSYLYNLPSLFGKFSVSLEMPDGSVEIAPDARMTVLFMLQAEGSSTNVYSFSGAQM